MRLDTPFKALMKIAECRAMHDGRSVYTHPGRCLSTGGLGFPNLVFGEGPSCQIPTYLAFITYLVNR